LKSTENERSNRKKTTTTITTKNDVKHASVVVMCEVIKNRSRRRQNSTETMRVNQ
jgi:hypothetical protein